MSMMSEIFDFFGLALLVAVLLSVLPGRLIVDLNKRRMFVLVLMLLCLFVPVYGLSVGLWLRSVVGDLSVISMIIFANILAQRLFSFNLVEAASRNILLSAVVVLGVVFYPLALGVSSFDPYHFGFSPLLMSVMLALCSIAAWLRARRGLAVILLLPLLAFNLHLLESANLWDYLLDPILWLYALTQRVSSLKFIQANKKGRIV